MSTTLFRYLVSKAKLPLYQDFFKDLESLDFQLEAFEKERLTTESPDKYQLLVIGGDGTLNYAVSQLMSVPLQNRPRILYLPGGTANDFFKSISDLDPNLPSIEIFNKLLSGSLKSIPVLQCNEKFFVNVASGLNFAEITESESGPIKNWMGSWLYYVGALKKSLSREEVQIEVLESGHRYYMQCIGYCVANGAYAGGGIRVNKEESLTQAYFGVLLVPPLSNVELANLALELQKEDPQLNTFGVVFKRLPEVQLRFPKECGVHLDGEPYTAQEMHFRCLPDSLQIYTDP